MAGFQVANFDFGKNITENNLKAAQIAASERASERRVELDKARLEEDARQFDERMAMADRAMEEGGSGSRASRSGGASSGGARSSQWDDAIRQQQYDDDERAFRQKNLELESFLSIRKSEDDDRANQQARIENAYGNAILASELGGGFLSPKQVEYFNSQNGTKYNYIGKVDPTSGEAFSDGKLHFITYNVDKNGRVVMDAKNGRPTLIEDNPISPEFYKLTLDGYFNKYKEHFGKRDIENSEYVDNEAYRSYKKNYKTSDPDHISNQMGGGAGGREIGSGAVMKKVDRRPSDVEMYSNFREPGMTAGGYVSGRKADGTRYGYNLGRQKSEAELWHQFSVGPSDDGKTQVRGYKNELTGEVAYVKDGENPPWRQSQGNNGKLSLDDRLAIEREKNKGKIDVENARGQNRIDVASANNKSRESIADKNNAAKLKIADIGAELKRLGFEVDEKKLAEAIRHNKANEATANSRVAETTRHNQVAEGQGQSRLDETSRHNKANEAHQSAELDEKKRHAMTSEEIAKETVTLKKRMQDFKERMAKPQNNSITSNLPESVIASNKKKILEMEKIINNGGAMSEENFKLVNDRFNKLVSDTFSGSPYEEKQSLEVPEGTRIPDGAITTEPAGYKVNNKTHMMVYYWLDANGERIYGDQIPMNR